MATPHRDFDARPRTAPQVSGTLDLGGVTWRIRSRSDVPYELLRQLLGDDTNPEGIADLPPAEQRDRARRVLVQTDDFFAQTIVDEQVDAFLAMVHAKSGPFTLEMSQEVTKYISECLFTEDGGSADASEGPTVRPKSSRPGRRSTGGTSKAGSSAPGTPRMRSAS